MSNQQENALKSCKEFIKINDLQAGKAGEYLVCYDLIMSGFIAFPSEQGLPYDIVAQVGTELIKIQVKSTRTNIATPQRAQKIPIYRFNLKRCGKHGKKRYSEDDVNVIALVSLDTKKIAYFFNRNAPSTILLRDRDFENEYRKVTNKGKPVKGGKYIDDFSFDNAIKI